MPTCPAASCPRRSEDDKVSTHRALPRLGFRAGQAAQGPRTLPEEVPVAISYNGTTQAVMMATPDALEDFARGFTLTEGVANPGEIAEISVVRAARGIDLQIWLTDEAGERLATRRRSMAGPVGCGLCGIDSIDEALREPRVVPPSALVLSPAQVTQAMALLPDGQVLHDATRAAHAAGFYIPGCGIVALREDVGRHNALDKLAGALLAAGIDPSTGAVILTSRVSIDMVQKTCAIGAPLLIAASAPTAAAVDMAEAAGLTLIALARGDGFEVFTHPYRIEPEPSVDVA